MKAARDFLFYFAGVILLGCLLAPPLYWAGQGVGAAFGIGVLAESGFQRYFHRAIFVAALALLWPLWRGLRAGGADGQAGGQAGSLGGSPSREGVDPGGAGWFPALGLRRNPRWHSDAAWGFACAFGILFAMGLVAWWAEVYRPQSEVRWGKFVSVPLTALVVSLLEEWFFRGAMLGLVRRTAPGWVAVLFTSALFSVVHFLKPLERELASVEWWSGFALVPDAFHQFGRPMLLLGGFATLLAIGIVLALATLRTRSLWAAVGLHAGWIAGSRAFNILFKRQGELVPWFGQRIEIGLAPLLMVGFTGLVVLLILGRRERGRDGVGEG